MSNKHEIFTSKEHYQAFRKAWAAAVNDERAKSHLQPCDEWVYDLGSSYGRISKGTGCSRVPGWITASHMMLYNILRDKPIDRGFSCMQQPSRLLSGHIINDGMYQANYWLLRYIKKAKESLTPPGIFAKNWVKASHEQNIRQLEQFLEPFNGTVTIEMLAKLDVVAIGRLAANYGKGLPIARRIISGERFTTTELLLHMIKEKK